MARPKKSQAIVNNAVADAKALAAGAHALTEQLRTTADQLDAAVTPMSGFDTVVQEIIDYTKLGMNVMLIGKHGVGKTAAIQEACRREGWNMWYASAPLLDPDVDLGGIPIPNRETGRLDFFTQQKLYEAEVLFLDELNRASPRTLNMVFELIQFKSIHGKKLPKLRAVHTGINPPGQGQYDVQVLDDALVDRFHAFIEVKPEFPRAIILPILGAEKTALLDEWYTKFVTNVYVSPRRLQYAAELHKVGIPLERAFTDPKTPVGRLKEMLASAVLTKMNVVIPVEKGIWMEPQFQAALNDPTLAEEHVETERIMVELGITAEQVWAEVQRQRDEVANREKTA